MVGKNISFALCCIFFMEYSGRIRVVFFLGSNKFCLDKNYGAWLIVWDRMFGTFQEEREDEEIIYGLVDQQVESFNPLYLQVRFGKFWCLL